jgi:hypothetical protein
LAVAQQLAPSLPASLNLISYTTVHFYKNLKNVKKSVVATFQMSWYLINLYHHCSITNFSDLRILLIEPSPGLVHHCTQIFLDCTKQPLKTTIPPSVHPWIQQSLCHPPKPVLMSSNYFNQIVSESYPKVFFIKKVDYQFETNLTLRQCCQICKLNIQMLQSCWKLTWIDFLSITNKLRQFCYWIFWFNFMFYSNL